MRSKEDFRDWHYLSPLQGTAVPSSLLFFDTETYPVKDTSNPNREHHHLRLWVANALRYDAGKVTREVWQTGHTQDEFWEFVCSRTDRKRPLWLFAHNIGFDLTVTGFWQLLLNEEFEVVQRHKPTGKSKPAAGKPKWSGIAVLNDPPTIVKFRLRGQTNTIVAVDTYNYFRSSLADIGESIGTPKGKMPPYKAPAKVWADYCMQDVKIVRQSVLSLIDLVRQEGMGKFGYTVSAQAMNAYRARFMPGEAPILIHGNRSAIQLERESFHSGAVHVWYVGRLCKAGRSHTHKGPRGKDVPCVAGPAYAFDVQSFYPSLMASLVFPRKLVKIINAPSYTQVLDSVARFGTVARVALDCLPPGFPVTRNGRTFYAAGKIVTTLAGPELERAVAENSVRKVWSIALYETAPLFADYVNTLWKMRQDYAASGNKCFAYLCKLLMNSLYGRFGMKRYKWQDEPAAVPPMPFGYWWEKAADSAEYKCYRALCWMPQLQCTAACDQHNCDGKECVNPGHCGKNPLEYVDSFPLISSYITAYGREELLRLARHAGLENCLYADTDSLHVTAAGAARLESKGLVRTGSLGYLRLTDTIVTAEYRGHKDYTINGKDTVAGIKPDAKRRGRGKYQQTRFQRLASILAGDQLDSVAVEKQLVQRQEYCPLGQIGANGRVETVLLNEW